MTSPLVLEKIWFEKAKYDEAERQYFENLAKVIATDRNNRIVPLSKTSRNEITDSSVYSVLIVLIVLNKAVLFNIICNISSGICRCFRITTLDSNRAMDSINTFLFVLF
jgi:hypothetical protein